MANKRDNRIQVFPRKFIYEIISGVAIDKGDVNKVDKPMQQKIIYEILESYCYSKLSEADRNKYRELYKQHQQK